ncbi:hypothetical protein NP493_140g02027 [Ridgeia piscesae]|uniref:Uncharacterized protein n=1 Tax=Ridgeia piscesae TaxID=27915 RepID=A0AAD9P4X4_RIDPI|nr:hypothetical protein NP493_140g02027 [Ridgeia piscesae]
MPPDNESCIRCRIGSAIGQFSSFVRRFLLRHLYLLVVDTSVLLNRFNVVIVNIHDTMDMWTTSSITHTTRTSDKYSKRFS